MSEAGQLPSVFENARENKYRQIFKISAMHFLSIWALIYVGVEVSLGGKYRHHFSGQHVILTGYVGLMKSSSRVDCDLHRTEAWRWGFCGIHLFWILWG